MKYNKEERLDIGRRIYNNEMTCQQAIDRYGIAYDTAKDYLKNIDRHTDWNPNGTGIIRRTDTTTHVQMRFRKE